jgi:hypothetical protein
VRGYYAGKLGGVLGEGYDNGTDALAAVGETGERGVSGAVTVNARGGRLEDGGGGWWKASEWGWEREDEQVIRVPESCALAQPE